MSDISGFFNSFLNLVLSIFSFVFETLDSIAFLGVSLLDFTITIFILTVAIPLVITLLRSRSVRSRGDRGKKREGDSE